MGEFLFNYSMVCWSFGLILSVFLLIILLIEFGDKKNPTKQERKDIRATWIGIIGGLLAPLTVVVLAVVLPFAVCYGLYKASGPVKRTLVQAFGREAVDE